MARARIIQKLADNYYQCYIYYDVADKAAKIADIEAEQTQNILKRAEVRALADAELNKAAPLYDDFNATASALYSWAGENGFDHPEIQSFLKTLKDIAQAIQSAMTDYIGYKTAYAQLERRALEMVYERADLYNRLPESKVVELWSADYKEPADASYPTTYDIGTIECAGVEQFAATGVYYPKPYVLLRPLFASRSPAYDCARDHYNRQALANKVYGTSMALLETTLVARHNPHYALAYVTAINRASNTGTLRLKGATPGARTPIPGGMSEVTLADVPFDYMTCNHRAFDVGDSVVVEFGGDMMSAPTIIGFEREPKPCFQGYVFLHIPDISTCYENVRVLQTLMFLDLGEDLGELCGTFYWESWSRLTAYDVVVKVNANPINWESTLDVTSIDLAEKIIYQAPCDEWTYAGTGFEPGSPPVMYAFNTSSDPHTFGISHLYRPPLVEYTLPLCSRPADSEETVTGFYNDTNAYKRINSILTSSPHAADLACRGFFSAPPSFNATLPPGIDLNYPDGAEFVCEFDGYGWRDSNKIQPDRIEPLIRYRMRLAD